MKVDIVGEDEVTRAILLRLLKNFRPDIEVGNILPARGGQIVNLAPKYNKLDSHILLLTDLDAYVCPPALLNAWFGNTPLNPKHLFRIAYGEAESWLMSDRTGFSTWIGANIDYIPESVIIDNRKQIREIVFPYKPSLFLMLEIASKSRKQSIRDSLMSKSGAKKGPLYNSTLIPFIDNSWNIEAAILNSTSLEKAVRRIIDFH